MTESLPALPANVLTALKVNTVLFTSRKPPGNKVVAHVRLLALISQRQGVLKALTKKAHKQFPHKRIQPLETELYFLDDFLGGTLELREDDARIHTGDTSGSFKKAALSESELAMKLSEHTSPLQKMAVCLKANYSRGEALPAGLSEHARSLSHKLRSCTDTTSAKTILKIVTEVCTFFSELVEMGLEPSPLENQVLTDCRELAA